MKLYNKFGKPVLDDFKSTCEGVRKAALVGESEAILVKNSETKIEKGQFSNSELYSVVIPEGVESIEDRAFIKSYKLQYVKLPSTLKKIGSSAFAGCPELSHVKFEEGLEEISSKAFEGCLALGEVVLPKSLKKVDKEAFLKSCHEICFLNADLADEFARTLDIGGVKIYTYTSDGLLCEYTTTQKSSTSLIETGRWRDEGRTTTMKRFFKVKNLEETMPWDISDRQKKHVCSYICKDGKEWTPRGTKAEIKKVENFEEGRERV